MKKEIKKKKNGSREEKKGEVFYKAHPIAPPIGRVERREYTLAEAVNRNLWRILGLVEVILLFRMVFAAFGVNGGNIFTSFIYTVSYPFIWFFFYLFNALGRVEVTAPTFELETLATMAFYYIIIYIITELIRAFRAAE